MQQLDDRLGVAAALGNLGLVEALAGTKDVARRLQREVLDIAREIGESDILSAALANVADDERQAGQLTEAHAHAFESLALCERLTDPEGALIAIELLAAIDAGLGDGQRAVELLSAADAKRAKTQLVRTRDELRIVDETLASARRILTDEVFDRSWLRGSELDLDQLESWVASSEAGA
jgi:Tetratricopeptide repeat